jgi:hypothetical protein
VNAGDNIENLAEPLQRAVASYRSQSCHHDRRAARTMAGERPAAGGSPSEPEPGGTVLGGPLSAVVGRLRAYGAG